MFFDIPKAVLEYMSPDEVARIVAYARDEAANLEDWNNRRRDWREPAPRWQAAAPPQSLDDYGKMRGR